MSDKLRRAQHMRARHARIEAEGADRPIRPRHAGFDRTACPDVPAGQTGSLPAIGAHAGADKTLEKDGVAMAHRALESESALEPAAAFEPEEIDEFEDDEGRDRQVGTSAAIISICTIISRITGFARTWAMAFALGATFVSSSYQVANNLPNMLYELVMGGLLATAFLPVYLSVKKTLGVRRSEEYASNLLTIVVLGLGIVSALCMIFPAQVIFTQTFYSNQEEMDLSVFLFQFFAIQVVFYGASSIVSGLLNANRDYLWGAIAPVFNNIIVIATFLAYAFIAPVDQTLAFFVIAVGNPLGVFVQLAIQIPALKKNGIRLKPRIDLRDPALKETVQIGLPALFVTICSFATVSVSNAASYCFADNGPSVIAYARLWFTFPYSFLTIPVATAMFTELSDMQADGNTGGVLRGIVGGVNQIFFLMIPFALYLVVFSVPLVTLYHMGAFTTDSITQIASYLAVMAIALPFYGVNTYLQMVFSSIRKMTAFSIITFAGSALQIAIIAAAVYGAQNGYPATIELIAAGTIGAYVAGDLLCFAYLRMHYGAMGLSTTITACLRGLSLGLIGAIAGACALVALQALAGPLTGSIAQAFAYTVAGGLVALIATFAPAVKLDLPEAVFVTNIVSKVIRRARR